MAAPTHPLTLPNPNLEVKFSNTIENDLLYRYIRTDRDNI